MNHIILHHQKKWLFDLTDTGVSALQTTASTMAEVENELRHFGAQKFDLADAGNGVYLADVSTFSASLPENFILFENKPTHFASKADEKAFSRALTFIEDCRATLRSLLGKTVNVIIDRKIGTRHPKRPHVIYPINYGYLEDVLSADGEGADVYVMGVTEPIDHFEGKVVALVHREDDIEDKLVVAPKGVTYTAEEIEKAVIFQEEAYRHSIILHQ